MSNKFLSSLHGESLSALTNGTASLFLKSLKVNDLEGSQGVSTDDDKFLSTGGGGSNIVTDLETKTQNISLSGTTPTQTVMTADLKLGEGAQDKNLQCGHIAAYSETCETKVECPTFRVSAATGGLVGYGGDERVIADYDNSKLKLDSLASNGTVDISATQGINVNNKVVTTRTTFTDNQELVSKAYVDANAGGDTAALDTKTQNMSESGTDTTQTVMTADLKLGQTGGPQGSAMTSSPVFNAGAAYNDTKGWRFTVSQIIQITKLKISNVHWTDTSINFRTVAFWDNISGSTILRQENVSSANFADGHYYLDLDTTAEGPFKCVPGRTYIIAGYRASQSDKYQTGEATMNPIITSAEIGGSLIQASGISIPTTFVSAPYTRTNWINFDFTTVSNWDKDIYCGGIHTTGDLVVGVVDDQTYTVHNGNQYADGTANSSFGFSFDVSEPITVTHLMISTNHWDGSGGSTEMKLWTGVNGAGGSTSYNVLSSNIVGDYYELAVSIPLAVGTTYTLSGIPPNSYGGTNITPDPVIQNYNARYAPTGSGAAYPGSTWSANYLWGAFGNFKFTKGPPPQRKDVYCSNVYADNIIPSTHDTYSLGTDTNRWNEIHAKTGYFAQQTIYLGDKWKLSVDETHPTASSIKLSHASQGHSSGVIDNEVVLANPTQTGMVVNHSNLSGDTARASNLTSGIVEDYTSLVPILEGQPVALDIDSAIKVTTITSATPAWQIVGVATNACNAGDIVEVCTKGFCNVRRVTTYESPTLKLLNSSTNNTTPVGLAWTFKDSGNDSNYSSNENYKITFDAQDGGTWTLTFNSFTFEHATSSMYDRLGIQTSSDGTTFTNVSIPWMQKSASSSPPWSSSFAGASWNSTSSKNGYIVPENTTRAILLGWDQQPLTINARYIRFTFYSDSSSTDPGWDITLVSSNYGAGNATVLPYGSPLYLDTSGSGDYTNVSTSGSNIIAYSASSDSSGDQIYCYIP